MSKKYPTYTIELYQGSTEALPIAFYSVDGSTKTPTIISNDADIVLTVRDELSMDVLFTMSKSNSDIEIGTLNQDGDTFVKDTIGNGNNYAIRINFPSSMTEEFTIPKMVYELMLVHDEDNKELLLHGVIVTHNGATGHVRP